jgi:DNA-binding transcriptional LysR family regulator
MGLLESMKVFVAAVDKGSLSAAAEACDMSPTMAGNHVKALEARLGARLMHRTTRRQHLTAFGEDYHERCREILRLVAETDAQAQDLRVAPAGTLRLTAPVSFGTEALMPALATYLTCHPAVTVDVALCDRVVDLLEEGFEAAIRIGHLPDSALVARPLAPYRLMLCAAPSYLARRGTPATPDDLTRHDCLAFSQAALTEWRLQDGDNTHRVPVSGRLRVNHGQALRVAALNGVGIVLQPAVLLQADVEAGRLVPLLPGFQLPSRPMSVVFPPDRHRSARLRSIVDFLVAQFPPT